MKRVPFLNREPLPDSGGWVSRCWLLPSLPQLRTPWARLQRRPEVTARNGSRQLSAGRCFTRVLHSDLEIANWQLFTPAPAQDSFSQSTVVLTAWTWDQRASQTQQTLPSEVVFPGHWTGHVEGPIFKLHSLYLPSWTHSGSMYSVSLMACDDCHDKRTATVNVSFRAKQLMSRCVSSQREAGFYQSGAGEGAITSLAALQSSNLSSSTSCRLLSLWFIQLPHPYNGGITTATHL